MKTFKSKSELETIIEGRSIEIWTRTGFIQVTKKALLIHLRNSGRYEGMYEYNDSHSINLQIK